MSTYYRPNKPFDVKLISEVNKQIALDRGNEDDIPDEELISIIFREGTINLFIKDGTYLHFDMDVEGNVIDVFRYGGNNADVILEPIMTALDGIWFASEHQEEYEGFGSDDTGVFTVVINDTPLFLR
jgi:hypothetical protein